MVVREYFVRRCRPRCTARAREGAG
jgi:hypothetical protein